MSDPLSSGHDLDAAQPAVPPVDDKDWTWVLDQPCHDCGFDPTQTTGADVPAVAARAVAAFADALRRPDAGRRPEPTVWSPLEYACHVRDVFDRFTGRARSMLDLDDPLFDNWDQDETALRERYWEQDPPTVAAQLRQQGERVAAVFTDVIPAQWRRTGRRSNGSVFTVDSLGRYLSHDVVHHLHDIGA